MATLTGDIEISGFGWDDQWRRTVKSLAILREHMATPVKAFPPSDAVGKHVGQALDLFARFFQDCFHVKDWVKNDNTCPKALRDSMEPLYAAAAPLADCADLANAQKHFVLNKHVRNADKDAQPGIRAATIKGNLESVTIEFFITVGKSQRNAMEYAEYCVITLSDLLKSHGLKV